MQISIRSPHAVRTFRHAKLVSASAGKGFYYFMVFKGSEELAKHNQNATMFDKFLENMKEL